MIIVPGEPTGKQRPRLGKGRVYTPSKTKTFEKMVKYFALAKGYKGMIKAGDLCKVKIDAYVKGRKRPDLDNIIKSVLDGLQGVVYKNDNQVISIIAKIFINSGEDKTLISVWKKT
jgi:crossover junction endodeoxyribonuclease RusA